MRARVSLQHCRRTLTVLAPRMSAPPGSPPWVEFRGPNAAEQRRAQSHADHSTRRSRQQTCDEPEDEGVGARGGGSRGEAGGGCGAQRTTGGEVGVRPQRGVQGMRAVGGGMRAVGGGAAAPGGRQ